MASSSSSFSSSFLAVTFILFLSLPIQTRGADVDSDSDPNLIAKTCKKTPSPDLCISVLKSDPSAASANTKALAIMMINAATTNATAVSFYLTSQIKSGGGNAKEQEAVRECVAKYSDVKDSLQSAMQGVYREMKTSAAADVKKAGVITSGCKDAYKTAGVAYPTRIVEGEANVKKLCAVAGAIIVQVPVEQDDN